MIAPVDGAGIDCRYVLAIAIYLISRVVRPRHGVDLAWFTARFPAE